MCDPWEELEIVHLGDTHRPELTLHIGFASHRDGKNCDEGDKPLPSDRKHTDSGSPSTSKEE